MGSYYRLVTHTPPHSVSPHPPEILPCYLPQPCPALPSPACSSPIDFGPSHKNPNFTPTLWRTGEESCLFSSCVCVCVYMCVSLTDPPSKVGFRAVKVHSLSVRIPGGNMVVTHSSLSITHIMARGEWLINTFLLYIQTKHQSHSISRS